MTALRYRLRVDVAAELRDAEVAIDAARAGATGVARSYGARQDRTTKSGTDFAS